MQQTHTRIAAILVFSSLLIAGAGCSSAETVPGNGSEPSAPTAADDNGSGNGAPEGAPTEPPVAVPSGMKATDPVALTDEQNSQLEAGASPHEATQLTFDVTGGNFWFAPNAIRVKKGDTVKIRFLNSDGFHNFVLDEFNASFEPIRTGETAEVEFVADKAGTFEYYCSVGSHRQLGQKGSLIVEE